MNGQTLAERLPDRIGRLAELAYNLWWSWQPRARALFRSLDYPLWRAGGHNPVWQLRRIETEKLLEAANDPYFLALYDSVLSEYDADMYDHGKWFETQYPDVPKAPIAFFSMEFAIHNSLPIYAGGLGILAGDLCKEASDLGVPVVGVGAMYPLGYFRQAVSADGWQEEDWMKLDFNDAPVAPVVSAGGSRSLTTVELNGRRVHIGAWQVQVGRTTLYLLDTGIEDNAPQDHELCCRLYEADQELRVQQEIILGIGGVRVLRALNISPSIWHGNEGHTAFMMLERVREEVEGGKTFDEAIERVRASTVFTTHTPVPAGHDVFPARLVGTYLDSYWESLGIGKETLLDLGRHAGESNQRFNMTALAMRLSGRCNGVSELHGAVSRRMWRCLWPEAKEDEVPIGHITNGVHVPTWIAPEMAALYSRYLAEDWTDRQDDPSLWMRMFEVPDSDLWAVRQILKRKLLDAIRERMQTAWARRKKALEQVPAMGAFLQPDVLTIGFVRRFAEYKRPGLLFTDVERLKRIVTDPMRPVQIVFAGKSHPADFPSQYLLHQVYSAAQDRNFQGRIAFVEDYDMHLARYLVHGVDVWLNNPRRLQEACGTSGMKASINGVPHLSVREGWWYEGYDSLNGWAIGGGPEASNGDREDEQDAEAIYRLLEERIVPLYYERDRHGVPVGWMNLVKETIRSVMPRFCARRMLKEYASSVYIPAAKALRAGGGTG